MNPSRLLSRCLKGLAIPAVLLLLLTMTSCRRDTAVRSALVRAEAVMEENPREARQILDSITTHYSLITNHSKKDLAHYAWLKTQADYKCYVPMRSDSLARIATDYNGTPRRKNYHAAMAWYTLGCVYTDQSTRGQATAEQAFDAYLKAKPLFPDPTNRYYALCCQNLGRCYRERTLYRDAIREYEASKRSSLARNDSAQVARCDYNIGLCHLASEEYGAADSCFRQVQLNPHAQADFQVSPLLDRAKIDYYYHHDTVAAISKLHTYIGLRSPRYAVGAAYYLLGTIYDEQGQADSAAYYYDRSLQGPNGLYSLYNLDRNELSFHLRQQGDTIHAERFRQFVEVTDSLYSSRNLAQLTAIENDHHHALEAERLKRHTLIVIAAALLLLMGILWYYTYRLRRKDSLFIQVFNDLRAAQQREEQAHAKADLRSTQAAAVRQFTSGPMGLLIKRIKNKQQITITEQIAFRQDLNTCFADVFARLRQDGYTFNHTERFIIAAYAIGLNSEESEGLLNIKDSTIRTYKKAIRDRLPDNIRDILFEK